MQNIDEILNRRKKRLELNEVNYLLEAIMNHNESYADDMFRQHSKDTLGPLGDEEESRGSRTSRFLQKMRENGLAGTPVKKKKKKKKVKDED